MMEATEESRRNYAEWKRKQEKPVKVDMRRLRRLRSLGLEGTITGEEARAMFRAAVWEDWPAIFELIEAAVAWREGLGFLSPGHEEVPLWDAVEPFVEGGDADGAPERDSSGHVRGGDEAKPIRDEPELGYAIRRSAVASSPVPESKPDVRSALNDLRVSVRRYFLEHANAPPHGADLSRAMERAAVALSPSPPVPESKPARVDVEWWRERLRLRGSEHADHHHPPVRRWSLTIPKGAAAELATLLDVYEKAQAWKRWQMKGFVEAKMGYDDLTLFDQDLFDAIPEPEEES